MNNCGHLPFCRLMFMWKKWPGSCDLYKKPLCSSLMHREQCSGFCINNKHRDSNQAGNNVYFDATWCLMPDKMLEHSSCWIQHGKKSYPKS